MVRTQVQLTDDQARRLKSMAGERGISMAALIRDGVERVLADGDRQERWRRALAVVGKYRSGDHSNVSEDHDRYLEEIYGSWKSS
jgi:Arc/MetJ-type ribon-helix-helix transcriptional regulator